MVAVDNFLRTCREAVSSVVATSHRELIVLVAGVGLIVLGALVDSAGAQSALYTGIILTVMGAAKMIHPRP